MTHTAATGRSAATGRTATGSRTASSARLGAYSASPLNVVAWESARWAEDPTVVAPSNGATVHAWKNGAFNNVLEARLADQGLVNVGGTNFAALPDSAATSITGNFSVMALANMAVWPNTGTVGIASHRTGAGSGYSWSFDMTTTSIRLIVSPDGTSLTTVSKTHGITGQGVWKWLLAEWRASDGRTQFFQATYDGSNTIPAFGSFAQISTDGTANVASIFDSTAPTVIGALDTAGNSPLIGTVKRFVEYNGLYSGGAATVAINAALDANSGQAFFTEGSTNAAVVSVAGKNSFWRGATPAAAPTFNTGVAALNNRPALEFLGSSSQQLSGTNFASLAQPYTIVAVVDWSTLANNSTIFGASTGGSFGQNASGKWFMSANTAVAGATSPTANTGYLMRFLANGASSALFANEVQVVSGNAGALALGTTRRIGCNSVGGAGTFLTGHIGFIGVYSGDITADAQWVNLRDFLRGWYHI